MNKEISFKLALLLDEKKFGEYNLTEYHYNREDYYRQGKLCIKKGHLLHNEDYPYNVYNGQLNAPTIAEVITWLYEKYGVWVHADYYNNGNGEVIWFYNYKTVDKESMDEGFNSPTEAYEAGITHVLENLI